MKGKTKDEQFIIHAYEITLRMNDPDFIMDKYDIGNACGISARAVDAIFTLLKRSNFVKNLSEREMQLTQNGENLAKQLLSEK